MEFSARTGLGLRFASFSHWQGNRIYIYDCLYCLAMQPSRALSRFQHLLAVLAENYF